MMPTVSSAARAGWPRAERTRGLAAAPARKVRRESGALVIDTLLDRRTIGAAVTLVMKSCPRSFRGPCLPPRQARDLGSAAGLRRFRVAGQHRAEIELRIAILIE